MLKTFHLLPSLLLFQSWSSAQNLVVNPSFEQLKSNAIVVPCQFMQASVIFWRKYPKTELGIAGHTDDVGSDEYNFDLSERRAKAVFAYLISKSISANRLGSKGFGQRRPVADNATDAGRQKNRRVECVLLKQ